MDPHRPGTEIMEPKSGHPLQGTGNSPCTANAGTASPFSRFLGLSGCLLLSYVLPFLPSSPCPPWFRSSITRRFSTLVCYAKIQNPAEILHHRASPRLLTPRTAQECFADGPAGAAGPHVLSPFVSAMVAKEKPLRPFAALIRLHQFRVARPHEEEGRRVCLALADANQEGSVTRRWAGSLRFRR